MTEESTTTGMGGRVVSVLYHHRGELTLIGIIAIVVAYMFVETFNMLPGTRRTPRFVIYLIFFTIAIILIERILDRSMKDIVFENFGRYVPEDISPISLGNTTEIDELDIDVEEEVNLYDVDIWSSIPTILWMVGYIVGVVYVGFFTTTTLFVVLYIYRHYESVGVRKRLAYGCVAAVITDGLAYLLFVRFLLVYELFDFGFLP